MWMCEALNNFRIDEGWNPKRQPEPTCSAYVVEENKPQHNPVSSFHKTKTLPALNKTIFVDRV